MKNALIISSSEKSIPFLQQMLEQVPVNAIRIVSSAEEARKQMKKEHYDLCIINTPLIDEFGDELAVCFVEQELSEVIVLVKNELYQRVCEKIERCGVVIVAKPISKTLFWSALKITQAAYYRMQRVRHEKEKLVQEIEDIRVVNRAKCLLISCLRMTELEAHKHIEKQAMDMRITRRMVSEGIIKTYDN